MTDRYRLIGANGSPYSVKLRALLRYRRLSFDWVLRTPDIQQELAEHIKVALVPVLGLPEGGYRIDSTKIIEELESRHPGERSVVPDDPGQAFLSHLLEDMADEWGTKMMFLLRWEKPVDQEYCARWIISDARPDLSGDALADAAAAIKERQMGRMALVGCTEQNAPVIKDHFRRVIKTLNDNLVGQRFLFGSRPALADFGWFGQLCTLNNDPSPNRIIREEAPDLQHWIRRFEDLSGIDGDWNAPSEPLSPAVMEMLKIAGEAYLPFLVANQRALESGASSVSLTINDQTYEQAPFGYQGKCLTWLREHFSSLGSEARDAIIPTLQDTGCLFAFQSKRD